jgi:hypothetical protein
MNTRSTQWVYVRSSLAAAIMLLLFNSCKKENPALTNRLAPALLGNATMGTADVIGSGTSGVFSIVNVQSGKAMEVYAASTANGGKVSQYTNAGLQHQKWVVRDAGNGYFTLMNAYSGKYLDVPGSVTTSGTTLNQYDSNGTNAQYWAIVSTGNGAYKIINKGNGLAVTNHTASTTDGTDITQETDASNNTQWWTFTQDTRLQYISNSGWSSGVQVYSDLEYNAYLTRSAGWNGGDGCYSLLLPNNSVLWTFQDSFFGLVDNTRNRDASQNAFRRNAGIVEENKSTTSFVQLNPGTLMNAQTWIQYDNLPSNDTHELYWPGDAQVKNNTVQVLLSHLVYNSSGGLDHPGTDLGILSLPGLTLTQVIKNKFLGNTNYDAGLLTCNDGYTYLYGGNDYGVAVARAANNDLTSPWEFYTDNGWQNAPDNRVIMTDKPSIPNVFKDGSKYYFVTQNPNIYLSKDVYIYESSSPIGPWTNKRVIYLEPGIDGVLTYNASLHQELSREGELVLSYNTNPVNFGDNFNAPGSADKYRPYFVRIYNWK